MRQVAAEAAIIDKSDLSDDKKRSSNNDQKVNKENKGGQKNDNTRKKTKNKPSDKEKSGKRKKPSCLNPKCDGYHFMINCPITSDEDKKKFLEERKSKRQKADGDVKAVEQKWGSTSNTSLFEASLGEDKIQCTVLTDQ